MTHLTESVRLPPDSDSLLERLAEAGCIGANATWLDPNAPVVADLIALLEQGPGDLPPPERLHSRDAWLDDLEQAHLALRSLPPVADFDGLRAALILYLDAAAPSLRAATDAWFHCRRTESAPHDLFPWSELRARLDAESVPDEPRREVLCAWLEDRFAARYCGELSRRVRSAPGWKDAYRRLIQSEARYVQVTKYDPGWSLDVARDDSELDRAALLEDAAAALYDPDLYDDLVKADEVCADDAPALLLLADDVYGDAVGEAELDEQAWWGIRGRLHF